MGQWQRPQTGLQEFEDNLPRRHRTAKAWQLVLQASTVIGIVVLMALLLNIMDGAFGYAAVQNKVDPETLALDGIALEDLSQEQLIEILDFMATLDDVECCVFLFWIEQLRDRLRLDSVVIGHIKPREGMQSIDQCPIVGKPPTEDGAIVDKCRIGAVLLAQAVDDLHRFMPTPLVR